LSISGSLTKNRPAKRAICSTARSAQLDYFFFLSGVKIPPLVFFSASEGFVDKAASHLALTYTKKGNMTEDAFAGVVLPHIKKYNPGSRVVVFDSATSHVIVSGIVSARV
jgi:hypothetical protein